MANPSAVFRAMADGDQQSPESGTWDVNASAMLHGNNAVFSQPALYHRTLADPNSVRYAGEHHDLAAAIN